MSVSDITKSINDNSIKNGASLIMISKTGFSILFDNSKDTEQGINIFTNLTENRFDDVTYYPA